MLEVPATKGVRPGTSMCKPHLLVARDRRGIGRRYAEVNSPNVVVRERQCQRLGDHGRTQSPAPAGRRDQHARQPARKVWPNVTDLNVADGFSFYRPSCEYQPSVGLL